MFQKLNFQYLLSYLGLIPYLYIILDKFIFFQIKDEVSVIFLIYYTILIFVFIGAANWDLNNKIRNHLVIYGFLPSLISVIVIILNIYKYHSYILIIILIFLIFLQLIFDYFIIYSKSINKNPFFYLRLPLTIIIIFLLLIFIIN